MLNQIIRKLGKLRRSDNRIFRHSDSRSIPTLRAFTLIELLVVISIIGILIGLSLIGLEGARRSSRDAKRKADLELIRSGLEIYRSDCNTYPATLTFGGSLIGTDNPSSCAKTNIYLSSIPNDNLYPGSSYSYARPTTYSYYLCATLEQPPIPAANPADLSNCLSCTSACNYVVKNP